MKRLAILLMCCLLPTLSLADPIRKEILFKLILDQNILTRDSGAPPTLRFIEDCLRRDGITYFVFECEDVVFSHYVSVYEGQDGSPVVLISRDGASVENRWVFSMREGGFTDVKTELWPDITNSMVSESLIKATGNPECTEEYVLRSAHSSYRIRHPEPNQSHIDVLSGIPDSSFKTKIGEIHWREGRFSFQGM